MAEVVGYERHDWFAAEDPSGRRCYIHFTDEQLAANPALRTDQAARRQFLIDEQREGRLLPFEDPSGRSCFGHFTDEELAANPALRTDPEARRQFLIDKKQKGRL